jgi:AraC-like DNA-binding protein
MSVQKYFPCDALKPFIQFYWLYNAGEDNTFNQLLPAGYVEIGFKLNDIDIITIIDGHAYPIADIKILGQLTSPGGAIKSKGAELLVVRFFMHTAALFFNHDMAAFTNCFYDFKEVFYAEKDSFYNRIREQKNIDKKIQVIEAFLLDKITKNAAKIATLKPIAYISKLGVQNMDADKGSIFEMQAICVHTGLSNRYIQRIFSQHVGISPKTYLKVTRFQRSLPLLDVGESYTAIAFKCGYFDQAHFIKEFKSYAGVTPASYRKTKAQYETITL